MTDPIRRRQWQLLLLAVVFFSRGAAADVVDSVNEVRAAGCAGGTRAPALQRNAALDEVARRVAKGASLHAAQLQTGYRAAGAYSVTIGDVPPDGNVRHIAETQFCAQSTKVNFKDIGVWREGTDVWLILAEPLTTVGATDRGAFSDRVLDLVNAARASARRCGTAVAQCNP